MKPGAILVWHMLWTWPMCRWTLCQIWWKVPRMCFHCLHRLWWGKSWCDPSAHVLVRYLPTHRATPASRLAHLCSSRDTTCITASLLCDDLLNPRSSCGLLCWLPRLRPVLELTFRPLAWSNRSACWCIANAQNTERSQHAALVARWFLSQPHGSLPEKLSQSSRTLSTQAPCERQSAFALYPQVPQQWNRREIWTKLSVKSKDSSLHRLDISLRVPRLNHPSKLISIFAQHSAPTTRFVDLSNAWLWRDIAPISHQKPDQNKWMRCKGLKSPFTWAKNNRPVLRMSQQPNTPAWTWLDNSTNFQTVHRVGRILLHNINTIQEQLSDVLQELQRPSELLRSASAPILLTATGQTTASDGEFEWETMAMI